MKKNGTVYKVVLNKWYGHYSLSAESYSCPIEFVLRYEIGERTIPSRGKIFVFDNLDNARAFANFYLGNIKAYGNRKVCLSILDGYGENISYPKYHCNAFDQFPNYWECKKKHKRLDKWNSIKENPNGTLFVDAFTAGEVVYTSK